MAFVRNRLLTVEVLRKKFRFFYEMSRIQQFRITENIQQHFDVGSLVVIIILDFSYSCFRKQSRLTYKD